MFGFLSKMEREDNMIKPYKKRGKQNIIFSSDLLFRPSILTKALFVPFNLKIEKTNL